MSAEAPVSVRDRWIVLGHPAWVGGVDQHSREQAERFYWEHPKLDGTRDGMSIVHFREERFAPYVPEEK